MNMNDYTYQALLFRQLSDQVPSQHTEKNSATNVGQMGSRSMEAIETGSTKSVELTEEVKKANHAWDALCVSLADKLAPPAYDYIPTPLQTSEQQRAAECRQIKNELKENPFIPLVQNGIEHLANCTECPEGITLIETLVAHGPALQALMAEAPNSQESATGSVAEQLHLPRELVQAVEKYAKAVEDAATRCALFALFTMLSPHRGDYWFCLSFSLFEAGSTDLSLKASWAAMALLPEQPEAYILRAALLSDDNQLDDARSLVQQAEELQKTHPLSENWEHIYKNLCEKFLAK